MAKKKGVDLPDWAKSMWEDMGSPELEGLDSVFNGDLLERRQGLRRDDFVEIHLNAQAFNNPEDTFVRGRLISSGKTSLEILTQDGRCEFISRDVIVKMTLVAHTRLHRRQGASGVRARGHEASVQTSRKSGKRNQGQRRLAPLGLKPWTLQPVGTSWTVG